MLRSKRFSHVLTAALAAALGGLAAASDAAAQSTGQPSADEGSGPGNGGLIGNVSFGHRLPVRHSKVIRHANRRHCGQGKSILPKGAQFASLPVMDRDRTAQQRYSHGAIALHWIIALLIAMNYFIAWRADGLPKPLRMEVMGYHKAWGILILALSVLRLVWRFTHRPPPLLESLKSWEAALAKVTHWLFYGLIIAVPLAGWSLHSAASNGMAVSWFGLFGVPALPVGGDKQTIGLFRELHEMSATLMLGLIALHVAASLKHIVIDRDGTMRRILPWG